MRSIINLHHCSNLVFKVSQENGSSEECAIQTHTFTHCKPKHVHHTEMMSRQSSCQFFWKLKNSFEPKVVSSKFKKYQASVSFVVGLYSLFFNPDQPHVKKLASSHYSQLKQSYLKNKNLQEDKCHHALSLSCLAGTVGKRQKPILYISVCIGSFQVFVQYVAIRERLFHTIYKNI